MKSLAVVLAVLTYNVHGLDAWVVDDDPVARMPAISSRLNAYDVALIQETWTYYDAMAAQATHPVKERGSGPHPGTFLQTGLATFARPAFAALSRGSLGACSGWLGGANDCLADKGYLRMRLRLSNGAVVDFWTLHLDAGDGTGDRAARAVQLANLEARVRSLSGDAALVVGGDFNSAAEEPRDVELLQAFASHLGLADSGARAAADGRFAAKHIDYVFVRSGTTAALRVVETGEAREFERDGKPLSDHPALFARLEVTPLSGP